MDYNPMVQGRTCGILINSQDHNRVLQKMCDVIRNIVYKRFVANQSYDSDNREDPLPEDSIMVLLQECVNHYLEYILSTPSKNNITFAYYISENFKIIEQDLLNDITTMSYLENLFSQAVGQLAQSITPAVEDLSHNGHLVEEIKCYNVNQHDKFYVLIGEDYGNEV